MTYFETFGAIALAKINSRRKFVDLSMSDLETLPNDVIEAIISKINNTATSDEERKINDLVTQMVGDKNEYGHYRQRLYCLKCQSGNNYNVDLTIRTRKRNQRPKILETNKNTMDKDTIVTSDQYTWSVTKKIHNKDCWFYRLEMDSPENSEDIDDDGKGLEEKKEELWLKSNRPIYIDSYFNEKQNPIELVNSNRYSQISVTNSEASTSYQSGIAALLKFGFENSGIQEFGSINRFNDIEPRDYCQKYSEILTATYAAKRFHNNEDLSLANIVQIIEIDSAFRFQDPLLNDATKNAYQSGMISYVYRIFPAFSIYCNDKVIYVCGNELNSKIYLGIPLNPKFWTSSGPYICIFKFRIEDGGNSLVLCDGYAHPILSMENWMMLDSSLERNVAKILYHIKRYFEGNGISIKIDHPTKNISIDDIHFYRPDFRINISIGETVARILYIEVNGIMPYKIAENYFERKEVWHQKILNRLIKCDLSKMNINECASHLRETIGKHLNELMGI